MNNILKSKIFWLVTGTLAFVIFVALLNSKRVYKTEIDLLIIPKSEVSASNANQIIENLRVLPYSLSFFNRMIEDNSDVADEVVVEMTPYKKKAYWRKKIEVRRNGESGILKIATLDKSQYQSQILAKQASQSLIKSVSLFYDIKKDVDIRIIDRPVTSLTTSFPRLILFLESLGAGFILVFFSFFISSLLFKKGGERKEFKVRTPSWYQRKVIESKLSSVKEEGADSSLKEKSWGFEKKNSKNYGKKAVAPDNLPVAPSSSLNESEPFEALNNLEKKDDSKGEKPIIREATAEEVRERLNKLLSGKL